MSLHLIKSGFTPGYKTWTFHGERAKKRARKKVRQIEPTREYDTGFDRCLENLANGNVPERPHVEAETPRDTETSAGGKHEEVLRGFVCFAETPTRAYRCYPTGCHRSPFGL